jgi:Phosphoribulokinase / Uridine kinase family
MALTSGELDELRGLADPIQLTEVEDVYLPLSRLLRLYYQASGGLRETVGAFLGGPIRPTPFIIAVAGSVAVGKSTAARVLRTLISRWPQRPQTDLVTTDSFRYPNAVLEQRGLADRKGFPESYDRRALLRFVQQVKAGVPEVTAPVYSHLAHDILPGRRQSVSRPDILILEGINVLQPAPPGRLLSPTSWTSRSTWTRGPLTSSGGSCAGCASAGSSGGCQSVPSGSGPPAATPRNQNCSSSTARCLTIARHVQPEGSTGRRKSSSERPFRMASTWAR